MPRQPDTAAHLAFAALMVIALVVVLGTYRDYGIGWDEGAQARYGDLTVDYFRSGLENLDARKYGKSRGYAPILESALSLVTPPDGLERFHTRHLITALFGLLTLPALFLCGRITGERWLAPAAAAALLAMPRFFGHLPNNSKDIPFAAAVTLTVAALALLQRRPGRPWPIVVLVGGTIGLASALRPGGLPLLAFFLAIALLATLIADDRPGHDQRSPLLDAIGKGIFALGIAWILLVLFWPWAHEAPLRNPILAMRRATTLNKIYPVLFNGETVASNTLPATYLLQFMTRTTPAAILALAPIGLVAACRQQWKFPGAPASRAFLLYETWLLVPLVSFFVLRPNVYDGLRHFLFLLPAIALFAGYGALRLVRWAPTGIPRTLAVALVGLSLLVPVADMVRLHPYQASYFNRLSGGLAAADGKYETDYWASSYADAIDWIRQRHRRGEPPLPVLIGASNLAFLGFGAYGDDRVRLTGTTPAHLSADLPAPFVYYVGTYRWGMDEAFPNAPIVHEISRDGVTFAVVKETNRPPAREPAARSAQPR